MSTARGTLFCFNLSKCLCILVFCISIPVICLLFLQITKLLIFFVALMFKFFFFSLLWKSFRPYFIRLLLCKLNASVGTCFSKVARHYLNQETWFYLFIYFSWCHRCFKEHFVLRLLYSNSTNFSTLSVLFKTYAHKLWRCSVWEFCKTYW